MFYYVSAIAADNTTAAYWVNADSATQAEQRFSYLFPEVVAATVHRNGVITLPADATPMLLGVYAA